MKFVKKPIVVEAEQWFPGHDVPGVQVEPEHAVPSRSGGTAFTQPARCYVVTIHGQKAWLSPGDWVITEPNGINHYPCKPDVFAQNYDRVTDNDKATLKCTIGG